MRVCLPDWDGVCQSNSHNLQAFGFDSPSNFASVHVVPPSALNSTFATLASHAHAAPLTQTVVFAQTVSPSSGRAISAFTCISVSGVNSLISSPLCQCP